MGDAGCAPLRIEETKQMTKAEMAEAIYGIMVRGPIAPCPVLV
jgi:hypothetical protein